MRNVLDCINAFIPLLSTEYELVLGRKGVSVTLRISFDKKDCFHLMGLQYLVDRPELSRDRGRVFDEIADGTITIEKIESSDFYNKIEQRVHFLPLLEQMIDAEKASTSLREVVDGIQAIADSAKKIKEISIEQADSMEQVEATAERIAEVVQNNSAAAQETSATSEELTAQATTLSGMVSVFKLRQ